MDSNDSSSIDAFLSSCRSRISDTLSPLSTPLTMTSHNLNNYRPWSVEDYLERVFGFKEVGWCVRPSTLYDSNNINDQNNDDDYVIGGPVDAALHGWKAVSPGEGIECVTCDARHYIPWPIDTPSTLLSPSEELESYKQLLTLYHDKIVAGGHEKACPWRRRACDVEFVGRRVEGNDEGFAEMGGGMTCVYRCTSDNHHLWMCPYSQRRQERTLNPKILLSPLTLQSLSHFQKS